MPPDIYEFIERMSALIRSEERKRCTELGLQLVHFQVLNYLARCNKYSNTPAATANFLGMTRGTVSQTLIILEKQGLIEKVQDTKDKRVVHLSLLAKGLEILKQAKPNELFANALAMLQSPNDVELTGVALFEHALTALQKANRSQSFGVCRTCSHFCHQEDGFFCRLTQEPLTVEDSEKICQEHVPV